MLHILCAIKHKCKLFVKSYPRLRVESGPGSTGKMADEDGQENDALLEKVDAVLDCIQPVYKDEKFDSLKQVSDQYSEFI